jgi:hypothetical protein
MKMLLALIALMPLSSFASEYAQCSLTASHYIQKSILNYEYVLTHSETLDSSWVELRNSDETLTGDTTPAHYSVTFSLDGSIRGTLDLNTSRPGSKDAAVVGHNEQLGLSVEHVFNSGKTVYNLYCSLDKH